MGQSLLAPDTPGDQPSRAVTPSSTTGLFPGPITQDQEIERKFLVAGLSAVPQAHSGTDIAQGYLAITEDGIEVRLRQKGDRYYQTVKSGGHLVRAEREIELTIDQFRSLWPATQERRIEKVRYKLDYEGFTIEVDVYRGTLEGLCVAEVEFASLPDSERFVPPAWFGREVTDDHRYKNKNLARDGMPR